MPGCHRRQKQSTQEDATTIRYQKLSRRVLKREEKKNQFIKERRKYGQMWN